MPSNAPSLEARRTTRPGRSQGTETDSTQSRKDVLILGGRQAVFRQRQVIFHLRQDIFRLRRWMIAFAVVHVERLSDLA
jgi:hypothetical protein